MIQKIATLIWACIFCAGQAGACTTFFMGQNGQRLMGKSYDWTHNDGMLVVNKRSVEKTALAENPARWVSKYGSVTFNQHGREFPLGGVNEMGLAVEIMWLEGSQYASSGRPQVNSLQWIQYQLDNFSSVGELLAHAGELDISRISAPVHYLACDRAGECASIEFIGGKLEAHSGAAMPEPALTNDSYADSVKHLKQFVGFGGSREIPQDSSSLSRFVRAAALAKKGAPALSIIESVAQRGYSQWNIIYDLMSGKVAFRLVGQRDLQIVDASAFDYSCASSVQVLPMNQGFSGDVTARFVDYSQEANRKIVERGANDFQASFPTLPPGFVEAVIAYPDFTRCVERLPLRLRSSFL